MKKDARPTRLQRLHLYVVKLHALKEKRRRLDWDIARLEDEAGATMKALRLRKYEDTLGRLERPKTFFREDWDYDRLRELLRDTPPSQYRKRVRVEGRTRYSEGKIELNVNKKSESLCKKFSSPSGDTRDCTK